MQRHWENSYLIIYKDMSREIKFRAWQTHHKEMYQPFVGYIEFPDIVVGFDDGDLRLEGEKNVILMQFTGLKDKHEVDIYEGDLLRYTNPTTKDTVIHEVVYQETKARFAMIMHGANEKYPVAFVRRKAHWDNSKFEIVGDIYTTPELLKAKD